MKKLITLFAAAIMAVGASAAETDIVDYELDCSTLTNYDWTENPATVTTEWNKDGADVIYNPEPIDPWYALQYWLVSNISLEAGTDYKITFECKAEGDADALIRFKLGDWDNGETQQFTIPAGNNYQNITINAPASIASNVLFFQHGDFVGKIYWKSIKITHSGTPVVKVEKEQDITLAGQVNDTWADVLITSKEGPEGIDCISITSITDPKQTHTTQFFITTANKTWAAGEEYKISFWYKASAEANCETQCHLNPGGYKHWSMLPSNPVFTTEWQLYEKTGKIPAEGDGMNTIAFNLNVNKTAITYSFADIHWYAIEKVENPGDNPETAINNVAVESAANAEFVNAAGQKVGKNYKGLVINKATGKKFINK